MEGCVVHVSECRASCARARPPVPSLPHLPVPRVFWEDAWVWNSLLLRVQAYLGLCVLSR